MPPKKHTIKAGENLSAIAKKHNLPGWQTIYFADCNKSFRRLNPDPDLIRSGGVVFIPASTAEKRKALQVRIQRLEKARVDAAQLFREQEQELKNQLAEINSFSGQIDAAATVLTLLAGLSQATLNAAKAMKLEGEALKLANKELAKDVIKAKGGQLRDMTATVMAAAKKESTNVVWIATRSVAQAWCDMTSPSFWANTTVQLYDQFSRGGWEEVSWSKAVTTTPDALIANLSQNLARTKSKLLADLSNKLAEARKELSQIR